jgi:hypothetical protein
MAKTLNHYSQQIKALAPDAVALDRAKMLGDLLIEAKAAVKAAGKLWGDWLQDDCELSARNAGRFMTIAKRWNEQAFSDARAANPALAIREADKVLAANSTRKRREASESDRPGPSHLAFSHVTGAQWAMTQAAETDYGKVHAGKEIEAAQLALKAVYSKLSKARSDELTASLQTVAIQTGLPGNGWEQPISDIQALVPWLYRWKVDCAGGRCHGGPESITRVTSNGITSTEDEHQGLITVMLHRNDSRQITKIILGQVGNHNQRSIDRAGDQWVMERDELPDQQDLLERLLHRLAPGEVIAI